MKNKESPTATFRAAAARRVLGIARLYRSPNPLLPSRENENLSGRAEEPIKKRRGFSARRDKEVFIYHCRAEMKSPFGLMKALR